MPFEFEPQKIKEVILVKPKVFGDARGFFMESYQRDAFEVNGIVGDFCQDNHSCSQKGVLRGLHFQMNPHAQGKLVRVTQGSVFDVAVDIRKGSPTYGQWVGVELTAENRHMLWVPPGFAHGFLTLSREAILQYKVTNYYSPENEKTLDAFDRKISIKWPLPKNKILRSNKDENPNFFLK